MSVTTAVGLDFMVNSITGQADLQRVIQQATGTGAAKGLGGAIEDTQRQIEAKYGRAYTNALKIGAKQEADQLEKHFKERQKKIDEETAQLLKANAKVEQYKDRADSNRTKKRWKAEQKRLQDSIRAQQKAQEKLIQTQEDAQARMVDLMDRGMQQAADNLETRTEKIGKGFGATLEGIFSSGGSIDPSQMLKSAGGGLKEAAPGLVARGGKMAGSSSKMIAMLGKGAMALGSAAGAIAGVAASLAAVVAVMGMAYGRAKDMNKAIMENAAALDFGAQNAHQLHQNLTSVRKATTSVAHAMRMTTEEVGGFLGAMNEAGLTFREMRDYVRFSTDDTIIFTSVAKQALRAAKNFGVGATEIAEFTNTLYRDMGQNFTGVSESLGEIFSSSQLANMSMRQFFTSINEATSSMALMNFRMEDTAELLIAMTDILGEDMGKEMTAFGGRFRDMGHTDRMRSVITGGSSGRAVVGAMSERMTSNFLANIQGSARGEQVTGALTELGLLKNGKLDVSGLKGAELGRIQEIVASAAGEGGEAIAIQLGKLARTQRGARAGATLGQQATALGQADNLGELAYGFVEAAAVLGDRTLGEMENLDRAAYENITGRSGGELEAMMDVSNRMAARIARDRGVGVESITAEDIAVAIASGEMHLSSGDKEALKEARDKSLPKMEQLAAATLKETTSIGQTLKNKISGLLEMTYSIISWWAPSSVSSSAEVMKVAMAELDEAREAQKAAQDAYANFDPSAFMGDLKEAGFQISVEEFDAAVAAGATDAGQIEAFVLQKRAGEEKRRLALEQAEKERLFTEKEAGYAAAIGVGTSEAVVAAEGKVRAQAPGGAGLMASAEALREEASDASRGDVMLAMADAIDPTGIDPEATYPNTGKDRGLWGTLWRGVLEGLTPDWALDPTTIYGEISGEDKLKQLGVDLEAADEAAADEITGEAKKNTSDLVDTEKMTTKQVIEAINAGNTEMAQSKVAAALGGGHTVSSVRNMSDTQLRNAMANVTTPEGKAAFQFLMARREARADDFVYRGGANGGRITPINRADEFLGMKPGGAISQAMGGGGVVNNFYINGNNPTQIVSVVRRAVKAALGN